MNNDMQRHCNNILYLNMDKWMNENLKWKKKPFRLKKNLFVVVCVW